MYLFNCSSNKNHPKLVKVSQNIKQSIALLLFICLLCCSASARDRKWKVEKVEFKGNETFNRSVLLSRIELKPPFLFTSTIFTEYKIRSDASLIERFYQSQGFLKARVEKTSAERDSSRYRVSISFIIHEETRFTVNSVAIQSPDTTGDSTMLRSLKTKTGDPVINSLIDEDIQMIKNKLGREGYLKAKVSSAVTIDTVDHNVSVRFAVIKGPEVHVDTVLIIGNKGLRDRVVRRELVFKNGDKLTSDKIQKSERKLYRTTLFSYVKIDPLLPDIQDSLTGTTDTVVPIKVQVSETDYFKVEAGAGYGTDDGFRGSLTTSYGNLLGLGHKVGLLGNLSQKQQEIEGRYSVPWLLTLPLKFDISPYIRNQTDEENTFDALRRGVELTAGQQTDFNMAYRLWLKWEDVLRLSLNDNVKNTQGIGLDLVWDTRTDLINPVNGTYNEMKIATSGLTDKRASQFVKVTADSRLYWKLGSFKYASRLRLGWSTTFGSTDSLPLQERFFNGGSRTVRGFENGTIRRDTVVGKIRNLSGTTQLTLNILEIRFPIVWWFEGALFTDAGYVWIKELGESLTFNVLRNLRWTAGAGIRLNTPVAVLRLDVGAKLDKHTDEKLMVLHLDVGNTF